MEEIKEHKCEIIIRNISEIKYPDNFVEYHFTEEQFNAEIERISKLNDYIIVNIDHYNRRYIVAVEGILVDDMVMVKREDTPTERNMSYN